MTSSRLLPIWNSLRKRFLAIVRRSHQTEHTLNQTTDSKSYVQDPAAFGIEIASLNLDAAQRQGSIGRGYARTSDQEELLAHLKDGNLILSPHPVWKADFTHWTADPFQDRNWRFQFHTLRWINPLLWDALDGSQESSHEWKRIVKSWYESNVPPQRAKDAYAWMDMTDGNRAIQLSIGAPLITKDDPWYLELLLVHRNWLFDDDNIVDGNHGLHQNLGLFVIAAVLNDEPGMTKAIDRLAAQILDAFDEQGLNEEGSVAYHQMNLIWWREAQQRVKMEGKSLPFEAAERLKKAGLTLAFLLTPDGQMPQIGDGNRGKGRQTLEPLIRQIQRGKVADKSLPLFHHYENGLTVLRSGWGKDRPLKQESHTIIRHGEDLLRHSHNDRGSVHIYSAGRLWITDGGFHSYQTRDPNRAYTKSRLAHSLVDLPDLDHDITGTVEVSMTQESDHLQVVQIQDKNFTSADWKRTLIFLPQHRIWIIQDRVRSATPTVIQQQWLADLGLQVEHTEASVVELFDENSSFYIQWLGEQPTIDIRKAQQTSKSLRGLIGVGWKKMKRSVSVHAISETKELDSIVLLSHRKIDATLQSSTDELTEIKFDSGFVNGNLTISNIHGKTSVTWVSDEHCEET